MWYNYSMANTNIYYFTFNSFIVVDNSSGRTLKEICKMVDNSYQPPVVDDELIELGDTVINVVGKLGEVVYTLNDENEPDFNEEVALVQVINQFKPVKLKLTDYNELIEWLEDAIFEDSNINGEFGFIDDEILYVYDAEHKEILA